MILFYYIFFGIALVVAGPFLLLQRKARVGLAQKLGFVPAAMSANRRHNQPCIWFHSVSVGEFNAIYPLLKAFNQQHPEYRIWISTTTGTGQKLASDKVGSWATVFYFPFDLPWAINNWLSCIKPEMVVIAETELWPGFTHECGRRGIKLSLVNGRISPSSFKGYSRIKWLLQGVLGNFSAIGVQSDQEAISYRALGAPELAVEVCGNMKIDGITALPVHEKEELARSLNLQPQDIVIVAGSTHEGEESALIEALQKLPDSCRLILVPRHPERFTRVCQIIESYGLRARRNSLQQSLDSKNDVYVLDSIGQLTAFYSLASIAFVGGTIAAIGGHSLIEPFAYNTPVVCGPHTEKTRDIARALLQQKALLQVTSDKLTAALDSLCQSPALRQQLGAAGRNFLDQNQGAVTRTMTMLDRLLQPEQAKSLPQWRQQKEPLEQRI